MAFAIDDKEKARKFYGDIIGCAVGREADNWIDFDFFGHQISAHINKDPKSPATSKVGDDLVPLHHFGAVLPWDTWNGLIERLRRANWPFVMEPKIRFKDQPGRAGDLLSSRILRETPWNSSPSRTPTQFSNTEAGR